MGFFYLCWWVGELSSLGVELVEFLLGFLDDVLGAATHLKGSFGGGLAAGLVAFGKVVAEGFLIVADKGGELGMGVNGEDVEAVDDLFKSWFLVGVVPLGDGLLEGEAFALGDLVSFTSDEGGQGEELLELVEGFFGGAGADFKFLGVEGGGVGVCEEVG